MYYLGFRYYTLECSFPSVTFRYFISMSKFLVSSGIISMISKQADRNRAIKGNDHKAVKSFLLT